MYAAQPVSRCLDQDWGYNWATLFLGDINTETGPLGWKSLRLESNGSCTTLTSQGFHCKIQNPLRGSVVVMALCYMR
jgi:hypothetical protein